MPVAPRRALLALVLAAMADAPAVVENDGINRLAAAARD